MTDRELLDQLSRDRSEAAFTELLRRHIDLVHSAALRQMGDAETARDITQNVFLLLAREVGRIPTAVILSGWLYRTTRHLCLETLRRDRRRREREHTVAEHLMNDATANPWNQVAPALEPAMDELGETDRQAILLRYFENRSLREVGAALGLGEDAAQKRVSRALDRLRDIFSRRGVSLSATALAGSLAAGAVQAAPAGLATAISTAALGGAAVAAATTLATEGASTAMNLINLKTAAAILGAAAVTGTTTYVVQERETEQLRTENTALNQTHAKLASDQQESLEMIQLRDEQIERLKRDVADLPRLRGEVDKLNRELGTLKKLESENEGLRQKLQQVLAGNSNDSYPSPSVLRGPITRESLAFAGHDSPEAALVSTLWAMVDGDFNVMIEGMATSDRDGYLRNSANREDFSKMSETLSHYFSSVQIVARKDLDPDNVELLTRVILDSSKGAPPPLINAGFNVQPLVREADGWRLKATDNPHSPDPQAWEREGRVTRYVR